MTPSSNGIPAELERVTQRLERHSIPEPNSGCFLWTGAVSSLGYGQIRIAGRGNVGAHRVAWEAYRNPIPSGLFVCHKCDVRACINPDHLFLGTHNDNQRDKRSKGRGCTVLTADLVREIRQSAEPSRPLAKRLGVGKSTVLDVRAGATWGDIT